MTEHISTMIASAVAEHLTTTLAPQFEDLELGGLAVKVGRLQADPERPGTNLMVHIGKPRDDKWTDMPVGSRYIRSMGGMMAYDNGEEFAVAEVGGGRTWLRRFTVEGSVFFTRTKEDRSLAAERANIIRGLVEDALTPNIMMGVEDSFGERAHRLILGKSTAEERGGPTAHIWDFWVYFSVETIRPH